MPLFVLMGNILERSGMPNDCCRRGKTVWGVAGGLGYSVIIVGALLANLRAWLVPLSSPMGLISLPAMMRANYDPKLSTGVICASSTLAQIIPPSTVLIFTADILSGVNQAAQMKMGNFAPDTVSTGDLFAGALIPGFLLVALYLIWMAYKAVFEPHSCPPVMISEADRKDLPRDVLFALIPPLVLIIAVLGSILAAGYRDRIRVNRRSWRLGACGAEPEAELRNIMTAGRNTVVTTAMIFAIVLAASLFSLTFRGLGGEHMVEQALTNMPGGAWAPCSS